MTAPERIEPPAVLIIMTGSAGRFVHCLRAFAALRMHHTSTHITAMVDRGLEDFAALSPYFDTVVPSPSSMVAMIRTISAQPWTHVYDFDVGNKTTWACRLAKWMCNRQHPSLQTMLSSPVSDEDMTHQSERFLKQIAAAGVHERPPASLAWVSRAADRFSLPLSLNQPFVLLALDSAGSGRGWEMDVVEMCCDLIHAKGHRPVLVGEVVEASISDSAVPLEPYVVDMRGSVSKHEVVFMSWAAAGAIGCDNDIMHLISAAGCKSVLLYDSRSDAARSGHLGPDVTILRRHTIGAISPVEAVHALYREAVA